MKLTSDVPSSEGVQNGLKRAKRLVESWFTPIERFPIVTFSTDTEQKRTYHDDYTSAWLPKKGFPYSSVRRVEKYIGYNVSFETFYSALTNPNSVVYKRPITGTGQNVHNHYGIVCSCFVSEVLDLPYRTPCARFPKLTGIEEVNPDPLENLRLLDIVLNVKKHIAIITGIERDEEGKVRFITVSESVLPFCRSTRFTTEEFTGYWLKNDYHIYRYAYLDRITYAPDPFAPIEEDGILPEAKINRTLMTDYGNKANYRLGEDVEISLFDDRFDAVAVLDPDLATTIYPVYDGKFVYKPELPGFYSVRAVKGKEESDPIEFCVTDLRFTTDKESYDPGAPIKITFTTTASDPVVAWQFNKRTTDRGTGGGFFEAPLQSNEITLTVPDVEDPIELYIMAKNRYGFYTSDRVFIKVNR